MAFNRLWPLSLTAGSHPVQRSNDVHLRLRPQTVIHVKYQTHLIEMWPDRHDSGIRQRKEERNWAMFKAGTFMASSQWNIFRFCLWMSPSSIGLCKLYLNKLILSVSLKPSHHQQTLVSHVKLCSCRIDDVLVLAIDAKSDEQNDETNLHLPASLRRDGGDLH